MIPVRSEVWEQPNGSFRWRLWLPGTDLSTRGSSPNLGAVYTRMDQVLKEWAAEHLGIEIDDEVLVLRPHFDGDTGPED